MQNSTKEKNKKSQYEYSTIKDLKTYQSRNIFAIVKFVKEPYRTRGSDYCLTLSVIDESAPGDDDKLKCVLFAPNLDKLPQIRKVGDIVRLHRLKISSYDGGLQGLSGPGFSCLTFDGDVGGSLTPHSTTEQFTFTDENKQRVEALREWHNGVTCLSQKEPEKAMTISSLTVGQYLNLTCQVVAVCALTDKAVLLRVWDGSKTQESILKEKLDDQHTAKLKQNLQMVRLIPEYICDVKCFDNHVNDATKIQPGDFIKLYNLHAAKFKGDAAQSGELTDPVIELCLHGGTSFGRRICMLENNNPEVERLARILEEVIDEAEAQENLLADDSEMAPNQETAGTTIQSRSSPKPSTSRMFTDLDSSLPYNTDITPVKRARREKENALIESVEKCEEPIVKPVTVLKSHHHVKISSLAEVLKGSVPNKYRVRVHLADYRPVINKTEDFVRLYCPNCQFFSPLSWRYTEEAVLFRCSGEESATAPQFDCPHCSTDESETELAVTHKLEYIFALRLLLWDGSDWIPAQLWRDHAITFFNGIQPTDVLNNPNLMDNLRLKLDRMKISGNNFANSVIECNQPHENYIDPWLDCCLMSYTTDKGTCYLIFNTALAEDL